MQRKLDRQIRVLISSTLREMHEVREELANQLFPELRKPREIRSNEIDLHVERCCDMIVKLDVPKVEPWPE